MSEIRLVRGSVFSLQLLKNYFVKSNDILGVFLIPYGLPALFLLLEGIFEYFSFLVHSTNKRNNSCLIMSLLCFIKDESADS